MKRLLPLTLAAAVVCVVGAAIVISTVQADKPAVMAGDDAATVNSAGYIVHFDPATGKVAAPSATSTPIAFDEEWRNALSTSSEGLQVVPSPVKGGGIMVDLQGRFRNARVAVTDENGKVTVPCVSDPEARLNAADGDNEGKE